MRILLVGEYSRLHNSLKEGLQKLGHEVVLIGDGDSFKNYPVDLSTRPKLVNFNGLSRKFKVGFFKLTGIDLQHIESILRFKNHKSRLKNFDVVQFINSNALKSPLKIQRKQVEFLKKHNRKLFLCACGTDTPVVEYLLAGKMTNHIMTPYLEGKLPKKRYDFEFKYISPTYKKYFSFFEEQLDGIIPSDFDYQPAFKEHPKCKGLIPNPVQEISEKKAPPPLKNPIHIFLGINEMSRHKKGTSFFKKALEEINKKYGNRVNIIMAKNLPYHEYIRRYQKAHIFLDMVYAEDQGFNALEAMAQGKVVFTGAGRDFLKFYGLEEDEVCINARPDVSYLVQKISDLIEHPKKIKKIGKGASDFVRRKHNSQKIAEQYVRIWKED